MKRSLVISLGVTVAITIIVFAATLGAGWAPKLGLDLAGGSEVVYKPAHTISGADMDTTVNVIRNRIDGAGVSGATVDSQGGNVVVQFPSSAPRPSSTSDPSCAGRLPTRSRPKARLRRRARCRRAASTPPPRRA
jgi:preprotein translocase subunit SecD